MNLSSLLILGYFYLEQVTLSSTNTFKNDENRHAEFPDRRKMELNDLSVELQLMVLENLNLIELLNMSSTNEYYRQLGADIFRRKIGARTIVFRRRPYIPVEKFEIASINEIEKSIYIENYDVMFTMLKNFGHLLTTLYLDYESTFGVERRKQITHEVSKYCSETLGELYLNQYPGFKLDYFPLSFKKLEKLSVNYISLVADETTLDKKFPALRHLKFKYALITKESVSGGEFMHLEHLSIDGNLKLGLETLILKCPILQSLQVAECPYELLSFINENVPQLVELQLLGTTFSNRTYLEDVEYRFMNVKKLFVRTTAEPPNNFNFEQLEELQIDGFGFLNEWLSFTVKNTNLKRLEFISGYLDNHELLFIANNLKNLEDTTILCDIRVQTETITQFVHNNVKLKKLKVHTSKFISSSVQASLCIDWNLVNEHEISPWDVELYFERK